jgi:hypothetical protein
MPSGFQEEQTLASQTLQIKHKRQLSQKEVQQPKKIGIKGVGKIEKHQVYSPTGQGSYNLISSLTTPSLEVITDTDLPAQFAVQAT